MRIVLLTEALETNLHKIQEPFWYHTGNWDIPATIIGMLRSLSYTKCCKVTLIKGHNPKDCSLIEEEATKLNIEIHWIIIEDFWDLKCEIKL